MIYLTQQNIISHSIEKGKVYTALDSMLSNGTIWFILAGIIIIIIAIIFAIKKRKKTN